MGKKRSASNKNSQILSILLKFENSQIVTHVSSSVHATYQISCLFN